MALDTSFDKPAPVRVVANLLTGYINRLGPIWVEGQIAQLTRRQSTIYLTLRDPVAEVSMNVRCARSVVDALPTPVTEGARVVIWAKLDYYVQRGTLSLNAREIRPIGVGELLARIEQRRQLLAAEGLFDPALKRTLPFLPRRIGLITGRDSAAEKDVLENAARRWPGVDFRVEHTAVQGHDAARQIIEAVAQLDKDPEVEVIVIARGGGGIEDLLPFSDEGLVRAVASCRTAVVSAIGHETDQPLLDLAADLRASTPTDAAKRVVPDVRDELSRLHAARSRARYVIDQLVTREQHGLAALRARPVLARPHEIFQRHQDNVDELIGRARRHLDHQLTRASDDVGHRLARVRTLSPLATLERGYAVLQTSSGAVVTSAASVAPGDVLDARLAAGRITATVDTTTPPPTDPAEDDDE